MGGCLRPSAQRSAAAGKGAAAAGAIRGGKKDEIESAMLLHQATLLFHLVPLQRISQSEGKFRERGDGNVGRKQHLPQHRTFGGTTAMAQSLLS